MIFWWFSSLCTLNLCIFDSLNKSIAWQVNLTAVLNPLLCIFGVTKLVSLKKVTDGNQGQCVSNILIKTYLQMLSYPQSKGYAGQSVRAYEFASLSSTTGPPASSASRAQESWFQGQLCSPLEGMWLPRVNCMHMCWVKDQGLLLAKMLIFLPSTLGSRWHCKQHG